MSTPIHGTEEHSAENEPLKQDTIFNEVVDISGYDKNLKTARIYLYVIAALQVLAAAYEYFTLRDISEQYALIAVAVDISIGIVFVALAVWSKKKTGCCISYSTHFLHNRANTGDYWRPEYDLQRHHLKSAGNCSIGKRF